MSLSGPLQGRKTYLKQILEPKGIKLLDVRNRSIGPAISYYQFMWDTASLDPHPEIIEGTVMLNLDEILCHIIRKSINSERVARRKSPRSVSVSFRHTAQVEVSTDHSSEP